MTPWFQEYSPEVLFAFKIFYRVLVIFFVLAGLSSGWVYWYGYKAGNLRIRILGGVFLLTGLIFCVPPYLRYQFHKKILIQHQPPSSLSPVSGPGR